MGGAATGRSASIAKYELHGSAVLLLCGSVKFFTLFEILHEAPKLRMIIEANACDK